MTDRITIEQAIGALSLAGCPREFMEPIEGWAAEPVVTCANAQSGDLRKCAKLRRTLFGTDDGQEGL